ncbi:MAG: tRNA preQ1(34) S-adenosylmethionine ribosyltransferase-isomerase QueA [Deltaproteobacteria bacterium]|nr:tRNA preQ1(34) S-adenosylmethionine ribosyltransferase-isomerase QueA [Deltaproteobacteria bacterium]
MRVDLFDFELPPDRIAQRPIEPRDASRMLLVDPDTGSLEDRHAHDLADVIAPGSVLVVNDTRVIPARLLGRKAHTGGRVEILLVRKMGDETAEFGGTRVPAERWRALGKASKPLRMPTTIAIGEGDSLMARIERRSDDDGLLEVVLATMDGTPLQSAIAARGHIPLPPYIRRDDDAADVERYQTVYARAEGAVAAPTAGLHLTNRLLGVLSARGVHMATVTLHVGPGTFQPVQVEDLDQHRMHEEWYEVPRFTAHVIDDARARGAAIVAVGTTTVRALESAADPERRGAVQACAGPTRLLIQPGYDFRVVDAMLTNFHLPRSTLLALISAFAGRELTLSAYAHAIAQGYRFYSYGDAMFIRSRGKAAGA